MEDWSIFTFSGMAFRKISLMPEGVDGIHQSWNPTGKTRGTRRRRMDLW